MKSNSAFTPINKDDGSAPRFANSNYKKFRGTAGAAANHPGVYEEFDN